MALLKNTLRTLVLAAMAATGTMVVADQPYHPFAEPMSYDPDWQFFAPVDVQDLDDASARQRARTGWYVSAERVQYALDRPRSEIEPNKLDRTWGNRFAFGFMSEQDSGIDFNFTHVSGPNVYAGPTGFRLLQPGTNQANIFNFPQLSERLEFDPGFGDGTFRVRNSLNVASLGSFEANKTWRLKPYQHGGILEPLVGFRYIDFTDRNTADGISGFQQNGINFEIFDISDIINQNRMPLGQFGFRYFRDMGRGQLSAEFKAFGGVNFQTGSVNSSQYIFADPTAVASNPIIDPVQIFSDAPGLGDKGVYGMDTRIGGSYLLTRSISFTSNVSLLYIPTGIARGSQVPGRGGIAGNPPDVPPNANLVQQNLIMPGISFGLSLNR